MIDIGNHNVEILELHSASCVVDDSNNVQYVEPGEYYFTQLAVDDAGLLWGYCAELGEGLYGFEPQVWKIEARWLPYQPDSEAYVALGSSGTLLVFENAEANPEGTRYVRFVVNDHEVLYWNSDEWEEDGQNVMGAILGGVLSVIREGEGLEV